MRTLLTTITITAALLMHAQAQSFLTNGLVAYYPFTGNANDESGNGNNGTVYDATLTTDRFGNANQAYYFNGTSAYIKTVNALPDMQSASVSCWIKPATLPSGGSYILMDGDTTPGNDFFLVIGSYTNLEIVTKDGTFCGENMPPVTNTWYHVVAIADSNSNVLKMWLNGQLLATAPSLGNANAGYHSQIYFGCRAVYVDNLFNGALDEVRFYNRALSDSEVQALYQYEAPPCNPHAATATATLDNGIVVHATMTDGGCGYTNTPTVRIIGGGGSGAQAVAAVSNGVVIAVNVMDTGSGYTNTPVIVIAPPFIAQPTLGIAAMSLLNFTNLAVGTSYQLQFLSDTTWSNLGAAFTATGPASAQYVSGTADPNGYRLATAPLPRQAFATAILSYGFVVHATVTSGGSGYVTIPAVSIVGGGGSNATAVAQISGGVVTGITITDAGIGYTTRPTVAIDPPPVPAVSPTGVLPVMRVDSASLAPYENYQIQFKSALRGAWGNWDGGLFSPTDVTNSQYLFITNGVGFFRLQYMP